jgi:hypothetical protein
MSIVVFILYGLSVLLALVLLYWFHARWYWHVLSVLAALAIGFSPPLPGWAGPSRDVAYGIVIMFLLVWGIGEPFLHRFHSHSVHHA